MCRNSAAYNEAQGTPMDMTTIETFVRTTVADLAVKVLAAIVFWFVGRWLIARVIGLVQAGMHRNHIDATLTRYLGSIISVALNIALVLGILGYFGIQTTSIAAMLAGAGVAIGAAWSGMLGNFAAGAFMMVLRPFKVGDFVSVAGVTGTVHELGLFGTTLVTPDNVLTLIGNGKIFAAGFRDPAQPDDVADAIFEAITTKDYRLRWPVGKDAVGIAAARTKDVSDELISLGEDLNDAEYNERFFALFGIRL